MNDKELLELAAKAAGVDCELIGLQDDYDKPAWNPLTDDGDALRLAVELCIDILHREVIWATIAGRGIQVSEPYKNDRYAATRRAIVRAAAEIGKGKNDCRN